MQSSRLVFIAACLGMVLFGASLITLGSVAAALREKFHLDAVASGAMFSILPVGILAGSLLFGPFADRYGYKMILVLSCLLIFAGFQGIAWALSMATLKASILLFGVGGGVINGASNAVVSDISDSHKGANLSLLGVFFGVGALGMPFILAILEEKFSFGTVVSAIGFMPLAVALLVLFTDFPPAKQQGVPFVQGLHLLKDRVLLAIGFFLFCLSSFEAIINNWTTTYFSERILVETSRGLYALSLYVAGMAAMRLLLGSAFRNASGKYVLVVSFGVLLSGCLLLHFATGYATAVVGLLLIGVGLAAGFPVMLGFAGSLYPHLSGTAFSIVLTIALIGNMLVNFLMGVVAEHYGVRHLTSVAFALWVAMLLVSFLILRSTKIKHVLIH